MKDPATLRIDLVAGLFDQVREIIGEASTVSMLHYAAAEEGRLLGAENDGVEDLRAQLTRLEPLVGSRLDIVENEADHIKIRAPGFQENMQNRPVQAVLLGLLEGLLSRVRNRPYEGTLNGSGADAVVDLQPSHEPVTGVTP